MRNCLSGPEPAGDSRERTRFEHAPRSRRGAATQVLTKLLAVVILAGLLGPSSGCAKKADRPKLTAPFKSLDRSFQPLRKDFEAQSDKVRLVAVVTPTCGDCMAAMQEITLQLLSRIQSPDVQVFAVWVSIMAPDVSTRVGQAAAMFPDPRITHYFDDSGRFARAFGQHLGLDQGLSAYNVFYLYGRNDTWDPNATMLSEPPDQNALMAGWRPTQPRYRMGDHPKIKMPTFDINTLTTQVEELLAEPAQPVGH